MDGYCFNSFYSRETKVFSHYFKLDDKPIIYSILYLDECLQGKTFVQAVCYIHYHFTNDFIYRELMVIWKHNPLKNLLNAHVVNI